MKTNQSHKLSPPAKPPTWHGRLMRAVANRVGGPVLSLHGPRDRRQIALTFDDGPDHLTPRYIEVLSQLKVEATFFLIGANAEKHPEGVRALAEAGHEVAGHGFTHTSFPKLGKVELWEELNRTQRLLPAAQGSWISVRPPNGAVSPRSLALTALAGYSTVLWSVDSDDCRTDSPQEIAARLGSERLRGGDNVLLHEGQEWTLEALPLFVEPLKKAGFEFVTVKRLLARDR